MNEFKKLTRNIPSNQNPQLSARRVSASSYCLHTSTVLHSGKHLFKFGCILGLLSKLNICITFFNFLNSMLQCQLQQQQFYKETAISIYSFYSCPYVMQYMHTLITKNKFLVSWFLFLEGCTKRIKIKHLMLGGYWNSKRRRIGYFYIHNLTIDDHYGYSPTQFSVQIPMK